MCDEPPTPPVAVVPVGEAAQRHALLLAQELRHAGVAADLAAKGNVGKRMKRADKIGATLALLLGDEEIAQGTITLKNLRTGEQQTLSRQAAMEYAATGFPSA